MAATAARAARARYTTFKGPALFVAFGWGLEGFLLLFGGALGLEGLQKRVQGFRLLVWLAGNPLLQQRLFFSTRSLVLSHSLLGIGSVKTHGNHAHPHIVCCLSLSLSLALALSSYL